jgi:hypothetical protein
MTAMTHVKQPNFFLMKRVILAIALPVVILVFGGMKPFTELAFVWGFISLMLVMFAYKKFQLKKFNAMTVDYFNANGDGIWSHEYHDTTMKLDTKAGKLYLKEENKQKAYNLSDIKECRYEIVPDTGTRRGNFYSSGFFITVNDVQFPEWQIKFFPARGDLNNQEGVRDMEIQLKRWMQIFDQVIGQE